MKPEALCCLPEKAEGDGEMGDGRRESQQRQTDRRRDEVER